MPFNIREVFGKGRVKVLASFDGEPYEGSIVNMGTKKSPEEIRVKIGKQPGDSVEVILKERA